MLGYPDELRNPCSLVSVQFDLVLSAMNENMGHINSVIIQVATALSTGNYFRSYPEMSFERNLTDVSRDLTSAADTCAMRECAAIKFQRMLGDFEDSQSFSERTTRL